MEEKELVSIIVLNFNAGKLLENCIESITKIAYKNIEIIVVDNSSIDESQNECKRKFPQIQLIQNNENQGFCKGNNTGIKKARGKYIIILNPDTIVEENLVSELVKSFKQNGEGLYQPKILSLEDKRILQSTGNMIHIFGFGFAKDKGKEDLIQNNKIQTVGYAAGTCLFSSKKIFEKLDFFDEFLFLYHDDLDIGWRAAQIGIKSYMVPTTKIFHAESYSLKWSKKKFYWLERNRKYCLLTHYSPDTLKKIQIYLHIIDFLVWGIYFVKGYLGAKIQAELDIKKNMKFIKSKQLEIERQKIIPDGEIIKQFPDSMEVPENVSKGFQSKWFLKIVKNLSKRAKNNIE